MKLRRTAAAGTLAVVAAAGLTVLAPSSAWAHGAATSPGSRTYLCATDGQIVAGDMKPNNAMCKQAVAQGGTQPLWDWFGVLRSDGAGRTKGYIPDGRLCSGGSDKYAAYDAPGTGWPATRLTSGANFRARYNAWAAHPGQFRLYVTKDGWNPNKALAWDDLETQPFSVWNQTAANGTDSQGRAEYVWDVKLPAGKTGRHIIYSVWERSDSKETFYGCSDVVFDGGKGQVIGIPGYDGEPAVPGTPTATPTQTSTATPTATATAAPEPTRTTVPPTPTVTATGGPTTSPTHDHGDDHGDHGGGTAPSACTAVVGVNAWPGGYLGTITVRNNGSSTLTPWKVTARTPSGVRLVNGWHATVTQSGGTLLAEAPHWNTSLAPGGQVSVGFVADGPGTPGPSDVTLNGTPCTVAAG